jgi:hypothetical protein
VAVLTVELTFPAAPITSLLKRIEKGVGDLYYASLLLDSPAYSTGDVWRQWYGRGFHLAIFDPPPGVEKSDRVRVRVKAPSRTPVVTMEGSNVGALEELEGLLGGVAEGEVDRRVLQPLVERLGGLGFTEPEVEQFRRMLQRAVDALTTKDLQSIDLALA